MKQTTANNNTNDVTSATTISCNICQTKFPSKTKLFQHLRRNSKNCIPMEDLQKEEIKDFLHADNKNKEEKIIILYGYIPHLKYLQRNIISNDDDGNDNVDYMNDNLVIGVNEDITNVGYDGISIRGGEDAARIVYETIWEINNDDTNTTSNTTNDSNKDIKLLRSYGSTSRNRTIINQEEYTSAVTELLCIKAPCILNNTSSINNWIQSINEKLSKKLDKNGSIRIFGRKKVAKKFNPELHTTQRRSSYLVPVDFLYTPDVQLLYPNIIDFFNSLPSFLPGNNPSLSLTEDTNITFDGPSKYRKGRPNETILPTLYKFKKIMQRLCTQTQLISKNNDGKIMEKEWAKRHRKKQKKKEKRNNKDEDNIMDDDKQQPIVVDNDNNKKALHVLCRKRYHNFTKNVMAHEFLSYRRIDRFYHRGTIRFDNDNKLLPPDDLSESRPYFLMGITGDQFLTGQIQGIIGLFIAIIHKYVDEEYIDCVFDENYPHLLSVPFIPSVGLYAMDAMYSNWEGKMQCILTPRENINRKFENEHDKSMEWNNKDFLDSVHDWEYTILSTIAKSWLYQGEAITNNNSILNAKTIWMEQIVKPWSIKANIQLQEYRQWKQKDKQSIIPSNIPNQTRKVIIPKLYQNVLYHLQQINNNQLWPNTTSKRQLVMVSTLSSTNTEQEIDQQSLSLAHFNSKNNDVIISSPYSLQEGQGGASGSFSIGYTPDKNGTQQPKSNTLFPNLVKSAFELEIALNIPNRKPSSTIAINRNAQFRPHLDSGIGTGQDISLIVGFGNYSGGELVIEKKGKIDIQYKPCEFDGWKERHWTMPFVGERYSLVWFTPKGCEGLKGIDLYP